MLRPTGSYHPINLKRLRFGQFLNGGAGIYGAAYRMTDAEKLRIPTRMGKKMRIENIGDSSKDILTFIRENRVLQQLYV